MFKITKYLAALALLAMFAIFAAPNDAAAQAASEDTAAAVDKAAKRSRDAANGFRDGDLRQGRDNSEKTLEALREAARRSDRSVADLVREAIRTVWLRPRTEGPVGLWDGEPKKSSLEHDSIYDEP